MSGSGLKYRTDLTEKRPCDFFSTTTATPLENNGSFNGWLTIRTGSKALFWKALVAQRFSLIRQAKRNKQSLKIATCPL